MKIGVFDSGVGGITVLAELKRRLPPLTQFVYLGDTAHVPYGPKSPAQIMSLSVECVKVLKGRGIKALVVACNTASSHALPAIREVMHPIPVFGVVEPGIEAALTALRNLPAGSPILVLATQATIRSHAYGAVLRKVVTDHHAKPVPILEQACPLLVPLIEEGWLDHPVLHQVLKEYTSQYANQVPTGVALLGCTHYPWIFKAFQKALPGWTVVDSAWAVAHFLETSPWFMEQARSQAAPSPGPESRVEWIFTDPEAVPDFAKKLM